jgi:hypothetical protein
MRKSLITVLTLAALAFAAEDVQAKQIVVTLTQSQVNSVCNGKSYCEVKCGSSGQYTCDFGCGSKSCSGVCTTCPTGRTTNVRTIRSVVTAAKRTMQ